MNLRIKEFHPSLRRRRANPFLSPAGLAVVLGSGARVRSRSARLSCRLARVAPAERRAAGVAGLSIADCKLQIADCIERTPIYNLQSTICNTRGGVRRAPPGPLRGGGVDLGPKRVAGRRPAAGRATPLALTTTDDRRPTGAS